MAIPNRVAVSDIQVSGQGDQIQCIDLETAFQTSIMGRIFHVYVREHPELRTVSRLSTEIIRLALGRLLAKRIISGKR